MHNRLILGQKLYGAPWAASAIAAVAVTLASGCGAEADDLEIRADAVPFEAADYGAEIEPAAGGMPTGPTQVRVIHASPDAPPVDVYIEGVADAVITDLAYGDATGYLPVGEGSYNFQLRAAGADPASPPVYSTGDLFIAEGDSISAVAAGLLGGTDPEDEFRVLALADGFDSTPGTYSARILHASADAPTVGIDVGNDGSDEVPALDRFVATGAGGFALPTGTDLQVGITAGGENVTAFTLPGLTQGGYLVIATGLVGELPREDDGFNLLVVTDSGSTRFVRQNPTVYALHAGPDAPPVDICVGGAPLLTDVPFGAIGGVQVPPGEYTLDIFAAPSGCDGTPAASPSTPPLQAGQRYLAIATGELATEGDDPSFALVPFVDDLAENTLGTFSIVHAASAPMVDVGVVQDGQIQRDGILVPDVSWPQISGQFRLPADTYRIGLAASGGIEPLDPAVQFDVPVADGFRGFVVAAGDLSGDGGEATIQLIAVDASATPWTAASVAPL